MFHSRAKLVLVQVRRAQASKYRATSLSRLPIESDVLESNVTLIDRSRIKGSYADGSIFFVKSISARKKNRMVCQSEYNAGSSVSVHTR